MSPIPTVKEFLSKNIDYVLENDCKEDVENAMIEFAKLHVEMALKAASEDANMDDDYYQSLQVYPLTNIK